MEQQKRYCKYCKDLIEDGDFVIDSEGNIYHSFCWEQMNNYFDGFYSDSEDNYEK